MTTEEYISARELAKTIEKIEKLEDQNAIVGAKAVLYIANSNGQHTLVGAEDLQENLGSAYTAVCQTAFDALVSALAALKSSKQADFDNL